MSVFIIKDGGCLPEKLQSLLPLDLSFNEIMITIYNEIQLVRETPFFHFIIDDELFPEHIDRLVNLLNINNPDEIKPAVITRHDGEAKFKGTPNSIFLTDLFTIKDANEENLSLKIRCLVFDKTKKYHEEICSLYTRSQGAFDVHKFNVSVQESFDVVMPYKDALTMRSEDWILSALLNKEFCHISLVGLYKNMEHRNSHLEKAVNYLRVITLNSVLMKIMQDRGKLSFIENIAKKLNALSEKTASVSEFYYALKDFYKIHDDLKII